MSAPMTLQVDAARRIGELSLDVRFQADAGLTALFGRSGAGKTSVTNILAGLLKPDHGRIAIGDHVLFDGERNVNVPPEKRRVGYVFQEPRLFPHLNVRRNLVFGRRFVPPGEHHQDFDHAVDLLDLENLLERRPDKLSGGEKQRVAIGRALLASPRLLLMDEPLAALDGGLKNEILPFIERLRDDLGMPIIYVSHQLDEVVRLADTMVLLDRGRCVAAGEVEDIMSRLDLRPLTGRYEAGAVLAASVAAHDPAYHLTELTFGAGRLWVPRLELPRGAPLRVRVRARDVSLSLSRPTDTSFLNIFEGTVVEIGDDEGPQVDVLVNIGAPIISRITRKSLEALSVTPGDRVHVLIKAAAIDRHNLGLGGSRRRRL